MDNWLDHVGIKLKGGAKKKLTLPQFLLNFSGYKHARRLRHNSLERWDP